MHYTKLFAHFEKHYHIHTTNISDYVKLPKHELDKNLINKIKLLNNAVHPIDKKLISYE